MLSLKSPITHVLKQTNKPPPHSVACIETHVLLGAQASGFIVNGYRNSILKMPEAMMENSIAATGTPTLCDSMDGTREHYAK